MESSGYLVALLPPPIFRRAVVYQIFDLEFGDLAARSNFLDQYIHGLLDRPGSIGDSCEFQNFLQTRVRGPRIVGAHIPIHVYAGPLWSRRIWGTPSGAFAPPIAGTLCPMPRARGDEEPEAALYL